MIFYPAGFELYVDNPGHGELFVVAATAPWSGEPLVHEDWQLDLYGPQLGEFLARVTNRALDTDQARTGRVRLPAFITSAVAATLLPALHRAIMLAIGGSDRYERTFPETDEAPAGPLCVRCNLGTPYSPGCASLDLVRAARPPRVRRPDRPVGPCPGAPRSRPRDVETGTSPRA